VAGRQDEDAFLLDVAKALYPIVHEVVENKEEARKLEERLGQAVAAAEAGDEPTGLAGLFDSHPTARRVVGLAICRLQGEDDHGLEELLGPKAAETLIRGIATQGHRPLPRTQALFYKPMAGRPRPMPSLADPAARPPPVTGTGSAGPTPGAGAPAGAPAVQAPKEPKRYKCTYCSYETYRAPGKKIAPRCPVDGATLFAA
jgi:hypothetical protein